MTDGGERAIEFGELRLSQSLLDEPGRSLPQRPPGSAADAPQNVLRHFALQQGQQNKKEPLLKGQWNFGGLLCIGAADSKKAGADARGDAT